MKRFLAVLLMATMVFGAFAIDISVGGDLDYTHYWNTQKSTWDGNWAKDISSVNYIGINVFGDFQYAIVSIGGNFSVGGLTMKSKASDGYKESESDSKFSCNNFNLKVLGKYPFGVGIAKLYPMAGFQFSFNTAMKYDGEDMKQYMDSKSKADLNKYFFLVGFGADIFVTDHFFIRTTPVFGVAMNKPHDYKENKDEASKFNVKYTDNSFMFNVSIGAGYKF